MAEQSIFTIELRKRDPHAERVLLAFINAFSEHDPNNPRVDEARAYLRAVKRFKKEQKANV
jgi:hypothetical protein